MQDSPSLGTAAEILAAIDDFEIAASWEVVVALQSVPGTTDADNLLEPFRARRPKAAFQNLIVGRVTELLFEDTVAPLLPHSFELLHYHERGENRDYAITRDGLELPINVKVASTLFRKAQKVVGLAPEDCIPIPAYKAVGASERVSDLLYVDLVDFDMRRRVDGAMKRLSKRSRLLWDLLSWYGGKGAIAAQNKFLQVLFERDRAALMKESPEAPNFRAVSAQRVLAIMRDQPRRVPGLGVRAAGTGGFNAEVNVHISVGTETVVWAELIDSLIVNGIAPLLARIRRTERQTVHAPTL